jgi:hypothetical protein
MKRLRSTLQCDIYLLFIHIFVWYNVLILFRFMAIVIYIEHTFNKFVYYYIGNVFNDNINVHDNIRILQRAMCYNNRLCLGKNERFIHFFHSFSFNDYKIWRLHLCSGPNVPTSVDDHVGVDVPHNKMYF